MRNRKLLTRRAGRVRLMTMAAGAPAAAILVEGAAGQEVAVAIQVAEAVAGRAAAWDVEVWGAGEDKAIAAVVP